MKVYGKHTQEKTRIKQGSGERMRKKGEKDTYQTDEKTKGEGYQKFNQFVLRNHWGEVTERMISRKTC